MIVEVSIICGTILALAAMWLFSRPKPLPQAGQSVDLVRLERLENDVNSLKLAMGFKRD